jgi:hypothetical protein
MQIYDGIDDELAGTVIGYESTPFNLDDRDARIFQECFRDYKMIQSPSAAEGENSRMLLKQDEVVIDGIIDPGSDKLFLQLPGLVIVNQAQIEGVTNLVVSCMLYVEGCICHARISI